jgi:hypothetical protein
MICHNKYNIDSSWLSFTIVVNYNAGDHDFGLLLRLNAVTIMIKNNYHNDHAQQ